MNDAHDVPREEATIEVQLLGSRRQPPGQNLWRTFLRLPFRGRRLALAVTIIQG